MLAACHQSKMYEYWFLYWLLLSFKKEKNLITCTPVVCEEKYLVHYIAELYGGCRVLILRAELIYVQKVKFELSTRTGVLFTWDQRPRHAYKLGLRKFVFVFVFVLGHWWLWFLIDCQYLMVSTTEISYPHTIRHELITLTIPYHKHDRWRFLPHTDCSPRERVPRSQEKLPVPGRICWPAKCRRKRSVTENTQHLNGHGQYLCIQYPSCTENVVQ